MDDHADLLARAVLRGQKLYRAEAPSGEIQVVLACSAREARETLRVTQQLELALRPVDLAGTVEQLQILFELSDAEVQATGARRGTVPAADGPQRLARHVLGLTDPGLRA